MNQPDELNSLHGAMSLSIPAVYPAAVELSAHGAVPAMHLAWAEPAGHMESKQRRTRAPTCVLDCRYIHTVQYTSACMHGMVRVRTS